MTFNFHCPKGHRFAAECSAEEAAKIDGQKCMMPGCEEVLSRDYSGIAFVSSAEGTGGKLEKMRRENRERSAEARKQAAQMQKDNQQEMVQLDYIPSGEGGRSRFGGDRISIPKSVITSLNEKGKAFEPPPEQI